MTNLYKRIKYYLTEMSTEKSIIQFKVIDKLEIITEHLLKCLLIQNKTDTLEHWCNEIYGFLNNIPRMKGNNKYPNDKLIYSWIIGWIDDDLLEWINSDISMINSKYSMDTSNCNKQSLNDCILEYYKWLSLKLSQNGKINNEEVRQQISTLINKYNKENTKPKVGAV